MGKKPSAKKKAKGLDTRGFATTSVRSHREDREEREAAEAEEAVTLSAEAPAETPSEDVVVAVEPKPAVSVAVEDEGWERMGSSRVEEELQKIKEKRVVVDAAAMCERKNPQFAPAGFVNLNKGAEERVRAALEPLREEDGFIKMHYPRHWRYKGKLTHERVDGIFLGLQSFQFTPKQIEVAMERTLGYDIRAPLEFLLVNTPKEQLPKQFDGQGQAEEDDASKGASLDAPDDSELAPAEGPLSAAVSGSLEVLETVCLKGESADAGCSQDVDVAGCGEGSELEAPSPTAAKDCDETGDLQQRSELEEPSRTEAKDGEKTRDLQQTSELEGPSPAAAKICEKTGDLPQKETIRAQATDEVRRDEKSYAKNWMMQYCEDDDEQGLMTAEERLERERVLDCTARFLKVTRQLEEVVVLAKMLKDKKKQASFKQNVSGDQRRQKEATAKMRVLKAELSDLESGRYGNLDREKISQEQELRRQAHKAPEVVPPTQSEQDDEAAEVDSTVEIPSLFDGSLDDANAASESPGSATCRVYNAAGWGGRSSKQTMEDFVRRRLFGKPSPSGPIATYERGRQGVYFTCRVRVLQPRGRPARTFDPEEACETRLDAENLAAAFALYNLSEDSEKPGLCRFLPPLFRQRWTEWVEEAAARELEAARASVEHRVQVVDRLLKMKVPPLVPHVAATSNQVAWQSRADEEFVDISENECSRLRQLFAKRKDALQYDEPFQQIQEARATLPVSEYRHYVNNRIRDNGVVVVEGSTGSGKTTQVPQFVLEEALECESDPMPNIIVTEPRRISAISVAKRVSAELGDPRGGPGSRGSLVGYQIRLERKVSESTRLLFCTVGVLLRRLQRSSASLSAVTHVFVDEVHERSADVDLLLLLLKQVRQTRPGLRVILMSATVDGEKLGRYFGFSVPVVSIPGRTFAVEAYWMEDIVRITGYTCDSSSKYRRWEGRGRYHAEEEDLGWEADAGADAGDEALIDCAETARTLALMDHSRINYDLIELVLECIEDHPSFVTVPRDEGAILIFLPGLAEITKLKNRLSYHHLFGGSQCLVLSLHSVLTGDDQSKAFERPPHGCRKIVISTNIAETGVTIPDVVFVVDACKVKSQRYHEPTNTSSLTEHFISRAELMQRRGRAGRVREGFCFHLVTHSRFRKKLQVMPTPEILRCSLMELLLSLLSSGMQPSCFLEAVDPPPKTRIDQAIMTLKTVGVLEEGVRPAGAQWSSLDDVWYSLTPLGQCLASLPCDVRLGKMVLLGGLFGCVRPLVTVASTLSHRSPLATPINQSERELAKMAHAKLLPQSRPPSDHLALNQAYTLWDEHKGYKADICRKYCLNHAVLQGIGDIRTDLLASLKADGFNEDLSEDMPAKELQSPYMSAALLFAGLYPNVGRVDAPRGASEKTPLLSAGSVEMEVHPGSLCHGRTGELHKTNHRWLCYHTKMRTSQAFLRDVTFVTPNALLLFAGEPGSMMVHPAERSVSLGSGGSQNWQVLHVSPRTAAMVRQLRHAFDAVLRQKATNSRMPLGSDGRAVIAAYIAIINAADD
uniref:RNA helicase n=1 Tax=Noctiluca scintillans TaxID=2966 RepID=A0A7S1F344_NOCSC|mmetsp:Transcript_29954/g.79870  ORF Transcript_29954/g.79870 Transcript_29954/m.79870 type:complete len:1543 (+) Transcript_29954:124-4752(+)